jgi:(R,R)-butanediol dehydrogenase/meso-butanediol dehydrogenase/diacetyl reductase
VLLKVARCGICKSDLSMTSGRGEFQATAGAILGHEFVGEVAALGESADGLRIGDRVAAMPVAGCGQCVSCQAGEPFWCGKGPRSAVGGFAEYVVVSARETVALPDSLSDDVGAIVEPLATALHGVQLAQLHPGSRIAIQGAGPIGLSAAFWARRLGAGRVAVIDTSRRREWFVAALGGDAFVVANGDDLQAQVTEALGGVPDVVIEAAGYPGSLAQAIDLVTARGTIVVLGYCTEPDCIVPARAVNKQVRMQFSLCYGRADFQFVVGTLATDALEPRALITGVVSLDDFPSAFEAMRVPHQHCKLLVNPQA